MTSVVVDGAVDSSSTELGTQLRDGGSNRGCKRAGSILQVFPNHRILHCRRDRLGDLIPCSGERGEGLFDLLIGRPPVLSDTSVGVFQLLAESSEIFGNAIPGIGRPIARRI